MPTVPLLSAHSEPHATPLSMVYRFNNTRNLVHEGDGSGDVIEHWDFTNLLPWEGDVLEQLHDGMRNIFQRAEMNPLVISELAIGHIPMVLYDFAYVFRRHILCNIELRA
jgi:hypothetical protein